MHLRAMSTRAGQSAVAAVHGSGISQLARHPAGNAAAIENEMSGIVLTQTTLECTGGRHRNLPCKWHIIPAAIYRDGAGRMQRKQMGAIRALRRIP
jgi:hypothetical protein